MFALHCIIGQRAPLLIVLGTNTQHYILLSPDSKHVICGGAGVNILSWQWLPWPLILWVTDSGSYCQVIGQLSLHLRSLCTCDREPNQTLYQDDNWMVLVLDCGPELVTGRAGQCCAQAACQLYWDRRGEQTCAVSAPTSGDHHDMSIVNNFLSRASSFNSLKNKQNR